MKPIFTDNTTGISDLRHCVGRALRTNGYLVISCLCGQASVSVNLHDMILRQNDICILTPDIYFVVKGLSDKFVINYVSLPNAVLDTTFYKITNTAFWDFLHFTPIIHLAPTHRRLISEWYRQMDWITAETTGSTRFQMQCNGIMNLLLAVESEFSKHNNSVKGCRRDHGWSLVSRFGSMIVKHSSQWHEVKHYADALNITPDYLYKVCRRAFGMTPKKLIEAQILTDIKSYLSDTDLSIKDISERMNFADSSYMCRFFRKNVGMSPIDFRNGGIIGCQDSDGGMQAGKLQSGV